MSKVLATERGRDADPGLAGELAAQAVAASPADPFGQSTVLECLAVMAACADGAGIRQPPSVRELLDPVLQGCREELCDDGFGAASSQGQRLTLAEAVGHATRGRGPGNGRRAARKAGGSPPPCRVRDVPLT